MWKIVLSGNIRSMGNAVYAFIQSASMPLSIYDDFETGNLGDLDRQIGGVGWQQPTYTASYSDRFSRYLLQSFDDMEEYTTNDALLNLNGRVGWAGPYNDVRDIYHMQSVDSFEYYQSGSNLNGLNSESVWYTAYRDIGYMVYDTFESYSSGSDLSNLNDGIGWTTSYLDTGSV